MKRFFKVVTKKLQERRANRRHKSRVKMAKYHRADQLRAEAYNRERRRVLKAQGLL